MGEFQREKSNGRMSMEFIGQFQIENSWENWENSKETVAMGEFPRENLKGTNPN